MKKITFYLLFLSSLALAACGSSGSGHGPASPATAPAAVTPAAPAPVSTTGPGDVPVVQTVREHQPFTLSYQENNLPTQWRVTLDSIACGTAPFSPAVIRADETSTGQSYAMPTAPAGQQFCLIKFSVTNESHSNQPWGATEPRSTSA